MDIIPAYLVIVGIDSVGLITLTNDHTIQHSNLQ